MSKDKLLQDAIADAKAVRETAIANAKLAIQEAFAPRLQSMISAAVQNENDIEEDPTQVDTLPELSDVEGGVVPEAEVTPEIEAVPEVSTEDVPVDDLSGEIDIPTENPDEFMEENDEYSLDSIIKELEQEAANAENETADPFITNEQEVDEEQVDEQSESTGFNDGKPTKPSGADNKKPSAKSSSNAATEDPQGNIKPNHPKAQTGEKYLKEETTDEVDEDINLEELIKELKEEYSNDESDDTEKELEELKTSINEHREVIKFLRSKLNEVNLLNAKLLFTNKSFKNRNLSEDQKLRVVEALDRAITIKEAKLVYSTLEESFKALDANKSSSGKKIVESIASKTVKSTKPSEETTKTVLNEGTDLAKRFQKLAGIIK